MHWNAYNVKRDRDVTVKTVRTRTFVCLQQINILIENHQRGNKTDTTSTRQTLYKLIFRSGIQYMYKYSLSAVLL